VSLAGAPFRLGYNTNGFAHHRLDDALHIMAELGYRAVALTPDANHLPPDRTTDAELRAARRLLEELGLAVVVETGARYVLDPRHKHRPNLLEPDAAARERRLDFLVRCAGMVVALGGDVVSVWSGALPPETEPHDAWRFLVDGVARLCERVAPLGVRVAFEPEPGMLVESLAQWEALRAAVAAPNLGLTLDVGHVPCTEPIAADEAIRRHAAELLNVHLDDSRGGVHEHLQVGEGELDWGAILRALAEVRFTGVASLELSRHSHAAPAAAREAIERLSRYI
jgi:sugar phosphate isomerase/epimerase